MWKYDVTCDFFQCTNFQRLNPQRRPIAPTAIPQPSIWACVCADDVIYCIPCVIQQFTCCDYIQFEMRIFFRRESQFDWIHREREHQHLARRQIFPSLLFYIIRFVFHLRWDPCVARNKSHMTICYVNMWMEQKSISESRLLSFGLSVASADWGVWNRKPMLEKENQSI